MPDPITVYATVEQLETLGMRAEALAKFDTPKKEAALETASRVIDDYLAQYDLPLMAIGSTLTLHTAIVAAYTLLSAKGLNPDQSASDQNVVDRYKETMKWLNQVMSGQIVPVGIKDSGSGAEIGEPTGLPRVISSESRGYSVRGTEFAFYRGPFQGG